ncbi:cell division topological specificity factor MinE [Pectinatus brassicae]|uniref:Cell division topological specificity factor n=1 Tax=Pectinatus brassicae TaxID=862415 RepID=A0A840UW25_9FIRM|nr:cell division topological specificity factor MinE [Pectinatus brassicae]MBB5337034.1 cell division topological specificity factor [Pectinatus brassicae]
MLKAVMRLFGHEEDKPSGRVAKDRLRVVLIHDRANISPEVINHIKDDIIKVISSYMDINQHDMEISLSDDENSVALLANIPVKRIRSQVMSSRNTDR